MCMDMYTGKQVNKYWITDICIGVYTKTMMVFLGERAAFSQASLAPRWCVWTKSCSPDRVRVSCRLAQFMSLRLLVRRAMKHARRNRLSSHTCSCLSAWRCVPSRAVRQIVQASCGTRYNFEDAVSLPSKGRTGTPREPSDKSVPSLLHAGGPQPAHHAQPDHVAKGGWLGLSPQA